MVDGPLSCSEGRSAPRTAVDDAERILSSLGQAVIVTDLQGTVTRWNSQAELLYGWSSSEALGRPISELTVAEVGQPAAAEIMTALSAGTAWTGAFPVQRKDGRTFVALVTDTALRDEQGRIEGVVGVSVNLGKVLRPFLVHSSEAALVTSPEGVVHYGSPAVETLFGWDADTLVGRPLGELVHAEDQDLLRTSVAAARGNASVVADLRVRRSGGGFTWVETRWTDMAADPSVRGLVVVLRDVDERHGALDRMTDLAHHDGLTGLPNRTVLLERLEHAAARRDRRGALLFVDLDDFKSVNDRLGHAAGDQLLRVVAERLESAVRPEDTCGRWAGDEFVVLNESLSTHEEAQALAARVLHALERPVQIAGTRVDPRASVGIALLDGAESADHVLREADREMYRIKRERTAPGRGPRPPASASGSD